jgi:non-ribosomal peptide synthetase component E (peptide arylation enzyme)
MAKPTRYTPELISEYMERGWWEPTSLSGLWDRNARGYPDKEAIVDSKTRLTWAQAEQVIDRLACGLVELGFEKDDSIVIQLPNCAGLPLLRVACEKAGILSLHGLMTLRRREIEYIMKHCGAVGVINPGVYRNFDYFNMIKEIWPNLPSLRYIFVMGDNVPQEAISINEMIQRPLEEKYPTSLLEERSYASTEVSIITLTSGTTGFPKFVEFPFCARHNLARTLSEVLELTDNDIIGVFGPAPAGPNCVAYFAAPGVRAKIVVQERFEAWESLGLIQDERITVGLVVPAQLARMVGHSDIERYDLSSLRVWWCVGAPVSYQLRVEAEEKLGGMVITGIGAVDFGGTTATRFDDPPEVRLPTVGKARGGTEIKLVDDAGKEVAKGEVGEIWGRGPACASGYFKDLESTWQAWTKDGWFKLGDLGKFDEQDNIFVMGRKKDMIIRGGQNIYPVEVEDLLLTHPKVLDVAIVGMPDPVMGEKACVYLVPRSGQDFSFDEMISFLKEKGIATYKLPERLEIVERLPMVGEQKVDKKRLVQDIVEKLQNEARLHNNPL